MLTPYPQPKTKAHDILAFIRENPGATRNAIITGLGFNPSIVRRYVQVLIEHRLVEDSPNGQGWHCYTASDPSSVEGQLEFEMETL